MTCIVGYEHEGRVWIGGDSAGTAGHIQSLRADEKVFATEDFVFGFCGSYRVGQVLRHALSAPPFDPRTDEDRYMAGPFVNAVRKALKDAGAMRTDEGVEHLDGPFLVGWRGKLYHVESDLQVGRQVEPFSVTGSGWQLAMGALHVLKGQRKVPPIQKVERALEAAAAFDAFVAGPFLILEAPATAVVQVA